MFLADTHLLGRRQGHWFDKLRREWQMHRAFQTAMTYFKPELVVFLGDVFDEGKWAGDDEFQAYITRCDVTNGIYLARTKKRRDFTAGSAPSSGWTPPRRRSAW